MRAFLALFAAAIVLFAINPPAVAGCDEDVVDTEMNVAGGLSATEIRTLIRRAREEEGPNTQVAGGA